MSVQTSAWLILAFPLLGAITIGLTYRSLPQRAHATIGTLAIALAFVATVVTVIALNGRDKKDRQVVSSLYDYAVSLSVDARMSILIDPLSLTMCLVVTGVSTMIHVYSIAYMRSDRGYTRFFAYLNFFVFSMLLLILAGNFVLLIIGWAFVGAASYLLISFWFRRTTATRAGIKAFVINVVGDIGLVLGAFFILRGTGSLDFLTVFERVDEAFTVDQPSLLAGCLLILVGAFAKSAQVPLHTWLPDAMEGPTPVSALIHAATMVTAGVYLIARMYPLFERAPTAALVAAVIGCVTLLVAATMGLVATDLKRVIAYSTMSQIGYMIMAVSSAAYASGIFHLGTHAFFKALLFMAAGSVIAAMANVQDLNRMGGFRKVMPFTYGCFIIGGLALAGVFPFSGLFSKDEILAYTMSRGGLYFWLGVLGYVGAFLTAIYTFRMIFRAFWGDPCPEAQELAHGHLHHAEPANPATGEREDTDVGFPGEDHHIAEQAPPMRVAMSVLAVGAIGLGVLQIPGVTKVVYNWLKPTFADSQAAAKLHPTISGEWIGIAIGTAIALIGIAIAYRLWVVDTAAPARIQARFSGLHKLFVNKWYFDELINALIVRPFAAIGRFANNVFEPYIVNGLIVGGSALLARTAARFVHALQSGFLRAYAALLVVGVLGIGAYFLMSAT